MSFTLLFGLGIQVLALVIVLRQTGSRWFSYTGVLFVMMACILHGMTEIVQVIFPGRNFFRLLVAQEDVDFWVLIVSFGILIFSLCYILVLKRLRRTGDIGAASWSVGKANVWVPDWRLAALFALPGYLVAVSGENPEDLGYWATGLTDQFLLFGIVLTSTLFLLKRQKWLIPIILVQSGALLLIGSRLTVLAGIVILVSTLMRHGFLIHRRQLIAVVFLVIASALAISITRAVLGREVFAEEASARVTAIFTGLQEVGDQPRVGTDVADDFIYRFDGNAFAAMISRRVDRGWPTVGLVTFRNDVFLAVPSFMNPDKLEAGEEIREEKFYLALYYQMPLDIDYLPTILGVFFSYYGVVGFMIICMILGSLYAMADNWLQRSHTVWALLTGIGLTYCTVFMERGVKIYLLTFRGIIILGVLFTLIGSLQRIRFGFAKRFV
jgi:hypothetical protein